MSDLPETAELAAFARTVKARSLSRAARELGMPRATLSRRLARLEERLSVRLLRRSTRSLALTDAGEVFYRQACLALEAVERAEESVRKRDEVVRGDLRVSAPPMNNHVFRTLICDFCERYPEVRLHLELSTRIVDLRRDGYDVALRASTELEPGLVARVLARGRVVAVASPGYLAKHGTPRSLRDLRQHRCLPGFARGELPQTHWPLLNGGKVQVQGRIFSNDLAVLCEAALRGMGIAFLPAMMIEDDLERGDLVHILPDAIGTATRIALVYLEREFVPPPVRAFVDAVVAWAPLGLMRAPARDTPRTKVAATARKRKRR